MKKKIFGLLVLAATVANVTVNAATINEKEKEAKAAVKSTEDDKLKDEASVNYLGEMNSTSIVFDVAYANPSGKAFKILITNNQGDPLFEQVFKGSDFNKKVMIKKDPDTNGMVNFYVKPFKSKASYAKSFYLNTDTKFVSNTSVENAD
ncbi:hypothetical protein [Rhizosphaericola mali]|uniref:DUF4352 domain-containing protein n=1 Tax=Rhizosphaericola mali TaxID=2545455 RepID=A0A5P2G2B8_9BACT|nr:hypothetical protein [Rhizosphaericola mali]QES89615.1 hypothetical protein E0W69_013395 [Rhizosphaericola mali]